MKLHSSILTLNALLEVKVVHLEAEEEEEDELVKIQSSFLKPNTLVEVKVVHLGGGGGRLEEGEDKYMIIYKGRTLKSPA